MWRATNLGWLINMQQSVCLPSSNNSLKLNLGGNIDLTAVFAGFATAYEYVLHSPHWLLLHTALHVDDGALCFKLDPCSVCCLKHGDIIRGCAALHDAVVWSTA